MAMSVHRAERNSPSAKVLVVKKGGWKKGSMKGKGGPQNSACNYRGVRQRVWGKWVAEIREPKKKIRLWLGSFATAREAALAYDEAARRLYGGMAHLNLPDWPPPKHTEEDTKIVAPSEMKVRNDDALMQQAKNYTPSVTNERPVVATVKAEPASEVNMEQIWKLYKSGGVVKKEVVEEVDTRNPAAPKFSEREAMLRFFKQELEIMDDRDDEFFKQELDLMNDRDDESECSSTVSFDTENQRDPISNSLTTAVSLAEGVSAESNPFDEITWEMEDLAPEFLQSQSLDSGNPSGDFVLLSRDLIREEEHEHANSGLWKFE